MLPWLTPHPRDLNQPEGEREVTMLRLLDLCHNIDLRPLFRPFGPHLGLRPRYTVLQRSTALHYAAASIMMMMMRRHGDNVYMTSQPITVQTDTSLF